MKHFKISILSKFLAILLSISLLGCTADETVDRLINQTGTEKQVSNTYNISASTANKIEELSGEDIFKGIYFLEGIVAEELVPEEKDFFEKKVSRFTAAEVDDLNKAKREIINIIKKNNPSFFNSFYDKMTGGNHYEIKAALDRSMYEYEKALMTLPGISKIAEVINRAEDKLEYNNFVDKYGNFDSKLYSSTIQEILKDAGIEPNVNNLSFGIVVVAVILAGVVIVAGVVAAVGVLVGVIAGVYLVAVAGQYIAVNATGWHLTEQDHLEVEMFIDEVSFKLKTLR